MMPLMSTRWLLVITPTAARRGVVLGSDDAFVGVVISKGDDEHLMAVGDNNSGDEV